MTSKAQNPGGVQTPDSPKKKKKKKTEEIKVNIR
jgi:hypothetical protein